MGIILPNLCSTCGSEPEDFRSVAGHAFACRDANCPVSPRVIARTGVAALTLWNLSQLPLELRPGQAGAR